MTGFLENFISYCRHVFSGIRHIKYFRLSSLRKVFSLMGKREKIAVVMLAVIAFVNIFLSIKNFYIGHTTVAATFGGVYTEGILGQPAYINPLLAHTEAEN